MLRKYDHEYGLKVGDGKALILSFFMQQERRHHDDAQVG